MFLAATALLVCCPLATSTPPQGELLGRGVIQIGMGIAESHDEVHYSLRIQDPEGLTALDVSTDAIVLFDLELTEEMEGTTLTLDGESPVFSFVEHALMNGHRDRILQLYQFPGVDEVVYAAPETGFFAQPGFACSRGVDFRGARIDRIELEFGLIEIESGAFTHAEVRTIVRVFGECYEAIEDVRLGQPPTPQALQPGVNAGPEIGRVWDPVVDHSSFAIDATTDFLLAGDASNIPTPFGTLLTKADRLLAVRPAGLPFDVAIPDDVRLLGMPLSVQAASSGPSGFELTNALDIQVGSYRP